MIKSVTSLLTKYSLTPSVPPWLPLFLYHSLTHSLTSSSSSHFLLHHYLPPSSRTPSFFRILTTFLIYSLFHSLPHHFLPPSSLFTTHNSLTHSSITHSHQLVLTHSLTTHSLSRSVHDCRHLHALRRIDHQHTRRPLGWSLEITVSVG